MLPMTRNFWRIYTTGIKKIFEFSYCCFFKTRYGKKIWLTEFAKPSTMSSQAELNYMKEILPYLEGSNHIWRYSWFVNRYIHLTCYYNQTLIRFTFNTYFHFLGSPIMGVDMVGIWTEQFPSWRLINQGSLNLENTTMVLNCKDFFTYHWVTCKEC